MRRRRRTARRTRGTRRRRGGAAGGRRRPRAAGRARPGGRQRAGGRAGESPADGATGGLAVVLAAGAVGTTWGLIRAEERRTEAERARADEAGQRRAAEAAEAARRAELARTAAAAGRLAARQGQWADAVALATTAIDLGAEDEIGLRLERLDCLLQLSREREAKTELDALVARPDQGRYAGRILLLRADAAMGLVDPGDPTEYARQAIALGLSPADAAYARMYLAASVPEAIAHIQDSHRLDPTRARALNQLCFFYFLTGRRPELRETAAQHRVLFPHSTDQDYIDLLAAALMGNGGGVSRRVAALRSRGDDRSFLTWLAPVLVRMQDEDFYFTGLGPEPQRTPLTEWAGLARAAERAAAVRPTGPPGRGCQTCPCSGSRYSGRSARCRHSRTRHRPAR